METKDKAIAQLKEIKTKHGKQLPLVYHCSEIQNISEFSMKVIRDNRIALPKYQTKKTMRNTLYKSITLNYPEPWT